MNKNLARTIAWHLYRPVLVSDEAVDRNLDRPRRNFDGKSLSDMINDGREEEVFWHIIGTYSQTAS